MKTCVVIPTYNECKNLPKLAKEVFSLGISDLFMYIVDDNSPDGTGEVAEKLAKQYPVRVIHRAKKEGLGNAYIDAFRKILKQDTCDYIIQMDADLSHDPSVIPEMLERIDAYDMVVGSRYIEGGTITNWHFLRRLVSRAGNIYVRMLLRIPYCDTTGGFRCFQRAALAEIVHAPLYSVGYNFQIEMLYRAHKKGYSILEIPITFTERKVGNSKFNLAIILESFYKVLRLRFKKQDIEK